jgi:hypothetical protein
MVLELEIDFEPGSEFPYPEFGASCEVYDKVNRSWRRLQFWQHETVISARVPRTFLQVPQEPDGRRARAQGELGVGHILEAGQDTLRPADRAHPLGRSVETAMG